eukprot:SAG22_NODE_348_length_11873_cov_4.151435_2_plen_91_part_00
MAREQLFYYIRYMKLERSHKVEHVRCKHGANFLLQKMPRATNRYVGVILSHNSVFKMQLAAAEQAQTSDDASAVQVRLRSTAPGWPHRKE